MRVVIEHCVYGVFIVLCFAACKRHVKRQDYVNYVHNAANGLNKIVQVDGWEFDCQYRPYDYIMLMESKGNFNNYDITKRTSELQGTAWFNISIKRIDNAVTPLRYGISSAGEYNQRLDYYLNGAMKDVKLVYGQDTLYPTSYLFENNYNLAPQETMVIGFHLPAGTQYPAKDMLLSYVDRIFKNGIIKATYSERLLNKIPALIY